ncbi:MAG: TIGR04283 family arsenosugar biosynthesis glycosyltransferase [Geobacteraceae bacterium]|nr:TIGR04283 family arsenosugar biosynthesis glycosyltransferase [Geobacteraceae bacterium]
MNGLSVSVIIPALREQSRINGVIERITEAAPDCEVIVVDGDPKGTTISTISDTRVIRLSAPQGRGYQLSAGVEIASGAIILMLHADSRLPANAIASIRDAVTRGADWGAFRLGIDNGRMAFRLIERAVDLRCGLFSLPYGDQGIFATTKALSAAGGIPRIPLMEDLELSLRLKRAGQRFALLEDRISTAARRWLKDGVFRRTIRNWWLLLRYLTGTDPEVLAGKYL